MLINLRRQPLSISLDLLPDGYSGNKFCLGATDILFLGSGSEGFSENVAVTEERSGCGNKVEFSVYIFVSFFLY